MSFELSDMKAPPCTVICLTKTYHYEMRLTDRKTIPCTICCLTQKYYHAINAVWHKSTSLQPGSQGLVPAWPVSHDTGFLLLLAAGGGNCSSPCTCMMGTEPRKSNFKLLKFKQLCPDTTGDTEPPMGKRQGLVDCCFEPVPLCRFRNFDRDVVVHMLHGIKSSTCVSVPQKPLSTPF
jgi:hypothetical protein